MSEKKNWIIQMIEKPGTSATTIGGIGGFGLLSQGGDFTQFIGGFVGGAVIGLIIHFIYKAIKK